MADSEAVVLRQVTATYGLLPALREVDLVLATGHSSADEGLMLVREGQRQGVRHMVVTHAMNPPIEMDVPRMHGDRD